MTTTTKKEPGALKILLASYLGFPGAGHLMLGYKRIGFLFLAFFSLGLGGIIYKLLAMVPLMQQVAFDLTNGDLDSLGALQSMVSGLESSTSSGVIFWSGLLATLAWAASGAHALMLMKKSGSKGVQSKEPLLDQ